MHWGRRSREGRTGVLLPTLGAKTGTRRGWGTHSFRRLRAELLSGAEQVGQDPVGAGDQLGKLAIKGIGNIDIGSLAGVGDEETAALRILTGVGGLGEGGVALAAGQRGIDVEERPRESGSGAGKLALWYWTMSVPPLRTQASRRGCAAARSVRDE